jgi:hypothetical protein
MSSCARHLGGCLLARAPDLFVSMKASACMKPDLIFLVMFAVLDVPLIPVSSDAMKMPREFMVINGFLWSKA